MAPTRAFYDLNETNKNGESLTIELTEVRFNEKAELPKLWKQHGFTKYLITNYIDVQCYVTDRNGCCRQAYNPTVKLSEDKERHLINFNYMLPISEKNKNELLNEVYKRFIGGIA